MGKRLNDRVAVISGAARGLGKAYCLGMAREGANIVAVDIADASATRAEVEALGRQALSLKLDISSEADTLTMARQAIDAFGRIDVLVTNAAVSPEQPVQDMTFADWRKVMAVDLDGVFLCIKAALSQMKKQKYGRIINISSSTFFLTHPNLCHYITAKAGVIGLTRALATELGEFGITVNAVSPGLTRTERTADIPQEIWDFQVSLQAIKRPEVPGDLVGTVIFLASEDAAFITGQTICVDGGFIKH
jgi:NAD(P)-dependent dehydrogenase (short-subunit alcohol dehydrogenase family)